MNYYRFSDLTISMTCRYDIMKRRAEKYLIPKAKENELSETTTPEIRLILKTNWYKNTKRNIHI